MHIKLWDQQEKKIQHLELIIMISSIIKGEYKNNLRISDKMHN